MFLLIVPVVAGFTLVLGLAGVLRLQLPLLYALLAPTLFRPWYLAHPVLGPGIFYGLLALSALSWVLSLVRLIREAGAESAEDEAAVDLFLYRLRKARESGEETIITEGLFR